MFTFRLTLWVSTGVDTAWMHCDATHLTQWRPGFSYMNLLPLWHHQRILKSVFTREIGLLFSWSVLVWLWYQGDGASQVALMVKNQCRRHGLDPWVGKIPWRRERLPTPVFWPGEFHGLQSMGSQRIGHDWPTFTFTKHLKDNQYQSFSNSPTVCKGVSYPNSFYVASITLMLL